MDPPPPIPLPILARDPDGKTFLIVDPSTVRMACAWCNVTAFHTVSSFYQKHQRAFHGVSPCQVVPGKIDITQQKGWAFKDLSSIAWQEVGQVPQPASAAALLPVSAAANPSQAPTLANTAAAPAGLLEEDRCACNENSKKDSFPFPPVEHYDAIQKKYTIPELAKMLHVPHGKHKSGRYRSWTKKDWIVAAYEHHMSEVQIGGDGLFKFDNLDNQAD